MLRGEAQQGQRYFATVGQGGICRLRVVVFELNSYARASHTPGPSLGRGDFGCCVFVGNEWFECIYFPSREGRFEMLFSY